MRVITEVVEKNLDKDRLDLLLQAKIVGKDDTKKAISMWWKQEQANILAAIRGPTS
jgi:hypothetical protein